MTDEQHRLQWNKVVRSCSFMRPQARTVFLRALSYQAIGVTHAEAMKVSRRYIHMLRLPSIHMLRVPSIYMRPWLTQGYKPLLVY